MRLFACLLALAAFQFAAAAEPPRWWKGNLHTHSLWSDGDDYPEMIAAWYKENGYQFLALSDHNIVADHERWVKIAKNKGGQKAFDKYLERFGGKWVETRTVDEVPEVRLKMLPEFAPKFDEPGRFLMVPSEEISDRFRGAPIHINASNIREVIKPQGGNSIVEVIRNNLNAVLAQRERTGVPMIAHINHPNFAWALTAEDMDEVEQDRFFEVYNGHPIVNNEGGVAKTSNGGGNNAFRASTERIWDIILTRRVDASRPFVYGTATDDSHDYHPTPNPGKQSRPGRGWVMVRADKLDAASLVTAMEAGDFYASTGVTLSDVRHDERGIAISIEPQPGVTYRTEFIGTRKGWDKRSEPVLGDQGETLRTTRRYSKDVGLVLAAVEGADARYEFEGDELYVRARITSSKKKEGVTAPDEMERAWTQPARVGK